MRSKVLGEHFAEVACKKSAFDLTWIRGWKMKFTLAFEKKNRANIGQSEGHNARLHATQSQLPEPAWFTKNGHHTVSKWDAAKIERAKGLAKRKDAVLAIELVIQVGAQEDWRELPSNDHPHGKPRAGSGSKLKALMAGAKEAAIAEFGADNIVSIELHTDESTPHIHIVATPIKDGKLQAKHWLDGKERCAALRSHLHECINAHIECSYTPGARGGEPHDPQKAAGGPKAPKPPKGVLGRAMEALSAIDEVKRLRQQVEALRLEIRGMFNKLKRLQVESDKAAKRDAKKLADEALLRSAAERNEKALRKRVHELEQQVDKLTPKPKEPTPSPRPLYDLGKAAGGPKTPRM